MKKPTLIKSNKYLRNVKSRKVLVLAHAIDSSRIEGIHVSRLLPNTSVRKSVKTAIVSKKA
jgi:hypothetical protein